MRPGVCPQIPSGPRGARRRLALALLVLPVLAACRNTTVAPQGRCAAAPRFQLGIEEDPAPARLLLDTATGDLWQWQGTAGAPGEWVRVARGPADARPAGAAPPEPPAPR